MEKHTENITHALLNLFCTSQLFHKVAALDRAIISLYKMKLKRRIINKILVTDETTTDARSDLHLCEMIMRL